MTATSEDTKTNLFVWEDPPNGPGRRAMLDDQIAQIVPVLRQHPGRWARLELATRYTPALKELRTRRPGFEFTGSFDKPTGKRVLFLRAARSDGPATSPSSSTSARTPAPKATPRPSGPVSAPRTAPLGSTPAGSVLACADCDFETAKVADIIKHTVTDHDRQATTAERTPVPA
jgi:hypothetical protein